MNTPTQLFDTFGLESKTVQRFDWYAEFAFNVAGDDLCNDNKAGKLTINVTLTIDIREGDVPEGAGGEVKIGGTPIKLKPNPTKSRTTGDEPIRVFDMGPYVKQLSTCPTGPQKGSEPFSLTPSNDVDQQYQFPATYTVNWSYECCKKEGGCQVKTPLAFDISKG